jgi:hypothetical protein
MGSAAAQPCKRYRDKSPNGCLGGQRVRCSPLARVASACTEWRPICSVPPPLLPHAPTHKPTEPDTECCGDETEDHDQNGGKLPTVADATSPPPNLQSAIEKRNSDERQDECPQPTHECRDRGKNRQENRYDDVYVHEQNGSSPPPSCNISAPRQSHAEFGSPMGNSGLASGV